MSLRLLATVACAALLAACATQAPRTMLPAIAGDPQQHQQQREVALAGLPSWSLAGRIALANGREGGSGRIEWVQDGPAYQVALSAPVTRQSWRLSGTPDRARLEGLEGGPRDGSDAAVLLREATRWEIPVEALASWVRGGRADEGRFGAVDQQFGEDGRLSQLIQGGWRIDYSDWRPVAGTAIELPHRLNAVRAEAKVRLIVDQWL
jgi:outer membrane lipoprotein LolB